ncbi:unnamed protein product [Lathyrus sativus]|nr:unnamed protein product [Lathyrus sativus]
MNLTDLPVIGNKFNWFNSNGKCRSRLDRFLVDDTAISMLSLINQLVGDRDISDHRPQSWSSYHVSGSYYNIPIKKLSALKSDIRIWNRNVFGWLDLKLEEKVSNLNLLELDIDLISISNNEELNKDRLRN